MFEYAATILKIIDADTVKLQIDLGFSIFIKQTCRLARINAPEMNTMEGFKARQFMVQTLTDIATVKVQTSKAEKYGRWLVELSFLPPVTGSQWVNLSDLLLSTKNAVPYP
jgi:micrococcal nuclease